MMMNKKYLSGKNNARQEAIEWQAQYMSGEFGLSYLGIWKAQQYFERLGKRYGLLKEFRENGII
jgi:hypothetical protein